MSHPLDGCWEKIKRANEHIAYLNAEVTSFCAPYIDVISIEKSDDGLDYVFKAPVLPIVPLRFAVIVGEVTHQLRSSLDHLMWALVPNRPADARDIYFPVCWRIEQFESAFKGSIIQGLSERTITKLKAIQPYQTGGGSAGEEPLTILHRLNVTDKHKLLLVVSSGIALSQPMVFYSYESLQADDIEIIPKPPFRQLLRADESNREIMRIRTSRRLEQQPTMYIKFAPQIALNIPWLGRSESVIPCLSQLRDATEKIVTLFAPEI